MDEMPLSVKDLLLAKKRFYKEEIAEIDRVLNAAYPKYDARSNGQEDPPPSAKQTSKVSPSKFILDFLSKQDKPVTISAIVEAHSSGLQGKERSALHSNMQSALNLLINKEIVEGVAATEGRSKYAYQLKKTGQ